MKLYRPHLKRLFTVVVLLGIVGAFLYCFRKDLCELLQVSWAMTRNDQQDPCTPEDRFQYLQKHPGELRLAMIGNWGKLAQQGRPRRQVIQTAIRDLNRNGGIDGRQVFPEWIDTNDSADTLLEIVEEIARDPSYYAVFGPNTSGNMLTVRPLLLAYKLLTFAPSVSNVHVTGKDDYPCIFLPNPRDTECVQAVIDWAKEGQRGNFMLISENQTFSLNFARLAEKMLYEQKVDICGRTYFVPKSNFRFFDDALQNYDSYFDFQHLIVINYSTDVNSYYAFCQKMLTTKGGDLFFYKQPQGEFTEEQLNRLYTLAYYKDETQWKAAVEMLSQIPDALDDPFSPAAYQSVFLLADACRQAKSMRQEDVIEALRTKELKTPCRTFRFSPERFEANPECRVITLAALRRFWQRISPQHQQSKE